MNKSALFAGLLLLASCRLPFGGDCVSVAGFGVMVNIVDSLTNAPPSEIPSLRLSDGGFVEIITTPNAPSVSPTAFLGAKERPGTYNVVVSAAGYADWSKPNVEVVRTGRCDVIQMVSLTARLTR